MELIPDFQSLYGLFAGAKHIPKAVMVAPEQVPKPYRGLLVHSHHMTVTVEQFYANPVNVKVLQTRLEGNEYSRQILLTLSDTGRVVQFGIVRMDLDLLSPTVREQIVEGRTPLGRVLIENNVLRKVEPMGFFRVRTNAAMNAWFGETEAVDTYGRLGVIHTDGKPAIEVLEILSRPDFMSLFLSRSTRSPR